MSLLSYNTDPSGLVLSIFRCKVKIVLRSYLKTRLARGKPLSSSSSWEDKLEPPEIRKLLHCAECYFVLIKTEVQLPPLAKCNSERYLFCASDGGKNAFSSTITVIFKFTINGISSYEATHLSLQSFALHVSILDVVQAEFLGMQRLLAELSNYLDELKALDCPVPADNILITTDSQILFRLLHTKLTFLKKKQSYAISKMLIMFHQLGLTPQKHLAYFQQATANTV